MDRQLYRENCMAKYRVTQYFSTTAEWQVEANSPEQASELVNAAEQPQPYCDIGDSGFDFVDEEIELISEENSSFDEVI
jgi:hypothetical protein